MIHPSYVDLMKVVNKGVEEGETPVINSRYSIVMATARRARQLVDGDESLVEERRGSKPLSIAIEELNQAKIRILTKEEFDELEAQKSNPASAQIFDTEDSVLSEETETWDDSMQDGQPDFEYTEADYEQDPEEELE